LRFNTVPDADKGNYDRWIPNDNPFNTAQQSAVYSYGHRNPQGLAYAVTGNSGKLFSSEHGPYSDDEINIIEKGKNYGHPVVIGFADGNYDSLAAGVTDHDQLPGIWHTTYPQIKSERENAKAIGSDYRNPIKTLYPNDHSFLLSLYEQVKAGTGNQEWPSEGTSSIDVYTASAIPGWKNSLLLPSLKHGHLIRLLLNADGTGTGDTIMYFKAPVRYRDIALSPDGKKIYLSTDTGAVSSGPSREDPQQISYKGCIIEFSYQGMQTAGTGASPAKKEGSN
jgi:glucose/arabinose dehydrogenase